MRNRIGVLAATTVALALIAASAAGAATDTVAVDGQDAGLTFDGVGTISASSSRLLVDYPPAERRQILDYLFTPHYGASLQILKVEIGGDVNSTAGAEPSHQRTSDEIDCGRGFEWWLMKEAKVRNPRIKLYGLPWGMPGWFDGGLWSQDHVDYIVAWLRCAERNGLHIDYVGGGNERGSFNKPFTLALDKALAATFPDVKVVATDQHVPPDYWRVATEMRRDPAFAAAIDIVGEHDTCVWRSLYQHCNVSDDALALGKPLWQSEQSSQDVAAGAGPLARAMNRNYIDARITGNLNWAGAAAFYGDFYTAGTGIIAAEWPWSGHYEVGPSVWVDAHTTQFTEPGWRYLDGASRYLSSGATTVALRSAAGDDYTIVAETMDATEPQTVRYDVGGGLSAKPVNAWSTDIASRDPARWFVRDGAIVPRDGGFEAVLQPHRVYTFSTTTGQRKGDAAPRATADEGLRLPYRERFEGRAAGQLAPLFSDVNGGFETAPCGAGRHGTCYRQVIGEKPIVWHRAGEMEPTTIVGDPMWPGDYRVRADAMLEAPGAVELMGRVEAYDRDGVAGYHLRFADDGQWRLYDETTLGIVTELASGQAEFGVGRWHRLELSFRGTRITASLDGERLAAVTDSRHSTGQVALRTGGWLHAQFDDVEIVPTWPAPPALPRAGMRAQATSAQPGPYEHQFYDGDQALDGRPETQWMTAFDPAQAALPQAVTIDMDRLRLVSGLLYKPPVGVARVPYRGVITGYAVSTSRDGRHFTPAAAGTWPDSIATKRVTFPWPRVARFVRLEATAAADGVAGAAELQVLGLGRPPAPTTSRQASWRPSAVAKPQREQLGDRGRGWG